MKNNYNRTSLYKIRNYWQGLRDDYLTLIGLEPSADVIIDQSDEKKDD